MRDKTFAIRPELFASHDHFVSKAIALSNVFMLQLLVVLNERFALGIGPELDEVYAMFLAQ